MNAEQVKKLPIHTYEKITEIMNLETEYKDKELRKNDK